MIVRVTACTGPSALFGPSPLRHSAGGPHFLWNVGNIAESVSGRYAERRDVKQARPVRVSTRRLKAGTPQPIPSQSRYRDKGCCGCDDRGGVHLGSLCPRGVPASDPCLMQLSSRIRALRDLAAKEIIPFAALPRARSRIFPRRAHQSGQFWTVARERALGNLGNVLGPTMRARGSRAVNTGISFCPISR
jgi:hypothetical protein